MIARTTTTINYVARVASTAAVVDAAVNFAVHASNALPPRGGTGADGWVNVNTAGVRSGSFNINEPTVTGNTYAYTFVNNMPSADYSVVATANSTDGHICSVREKTAAGFEVYTFRADGTANGVSHQVIVHASNAQLPDTVTQEQLDSVINSPTVSSWGTVESDGTKGNGGLNYTSRSLGTGVYEVSFVNDMPNANYSVVANPVTANARYCTTSNLQTNNFRLRVYNDSGNPVDARVKFVVHATNGPAPRGGTGADGWAHTGSTGTLQNGYNLQVDKPDGQRVNTTIRSLNQCLTATMRWLATYARASNQRVVDSPK